MALRPSILFALTSVALIAACGETPPGPPGGTGGQVNNGTGGQGNNGTGGQGNNGTGGQGNNGTGGQGNNGTGGGNNGTGGGNNGTGGGSDGTGGGGGEDLDEGGKPNASPGDTETAVQDYLRLGEIRILNNNWGSAALGCNTPMSVFVNQDSTFGWSFQRGNCDTAGANQNPDFPQIEFGIHPFGIGSPLATSPDFSSTTLLPLQIKDIQSAAVQIENLSGTFQSEGSWNITFEFWLSQQDPNTAGNAGVYAELMTFWGWQGGRWPSAPGADGSADGGSGTGATVSSGGKTYTLWVQRDQWAPQPPEAPNGWRYFQFRDNSGPQKTFNGTLDVKPFLDYLVTTRGYSADLWVTRLEVGSEIDDETQGTVQMAGVTFEVNGESRSEVIVP